MWLVNYVIGFFFGSVGGIVTGYLVLGGIMKPLRRLDWFDIWLIFMLSLSLVFIAAGFWLKAQS